MHELSIAESVIEVAGRHSRGRRVRRVEMKVGHLRQVVPSALEFAFELVAAGTLLEGAELVIDHVPATGECRTCGQRKVMSEFPLRCPQCGGTCVEVVSGTELHVESLELEDEMATPEMERM